MLFISAFTMELSLTVKSGIPISEGLSMLAEDEKDGRRKVLLSDMAAECEGGAMLWEAVAHTGAFDDYMTAMLHIGEETGRLEVTLSALSNYYDSRYHIVRSLRSAILYPAILTVLMLAVVAILITQVVPAFNEVAAEIGVTLSPVSRVLADIGGALGKNVALFIIITLAVCAAAILLIRRLYERSGLGLRVASAKFSAAFELIIKSGMDAGEQIDELILLTDNKIMRGRVKRFGELLGGGASLDEAAEKSGVLGSVYSRMLSVGVKTGALDTAVEEINRRCEDSVNAEIEDAVSRIEPTLIIIFSLTVGFVLLSVMLPMLNIMTAMG